MHRTFQVGRCRDCHGVGVARGGAWMGPGPDPNHLELQLLMAELYLLVFAEFYT